jgi:L,D-transpeptidase ErfK/SrfK
MSRGRPVVALALGLAAACHRGPKPPPAWTEATFAAKPLTAFTVSAPPGEVVVGEPRTYRVREGDTLLDVARWFDLGYSEIVAANPGVDPWIPPVGLEIALPTQWILPCCDYQGIVVNIPEMRLFFYERARDGSGLVVRTFPVGLGRDDRRTPRGRCTVTGKTLDPTWYIPPRIREEHIRERGDARTAIKGGAPDNPLGRHRIELTRPLYTIHGTDIPWGVGMLVSHGCVRLYPEDIAALFPLVERGTPVDFVYQAVKVAARDGEPWVEVHPDVYGRGSSAREAAGRLERAHLRVPIDRRRLDAAVKSATGVPVPVAADGRRSAASPDGTPLLDEGPLRLPRVVRLPERRADLLLAPVAVGERQRDDLAYAPPRLADGERRVGGDHGGRVERGG